MRILIRAGRLIDGTGAAPVMDGAVLVEDGHIVEVGRRAFAPADETIDLGSRTLLPGLIDCHSHISLPPQLREPDGTRAFWITHNLRRYLAIGCTTIRVVGEFNFIDVTARNLVEQGILAGPRILACGNPLMSSNGHGLGAPVDGVDSVRREVRRNLMGGANLIKIFLTGGLSSFNTPIEYCAFTSDEIAAAVDEAHRAGVRVAAHAQAGPGIAQALEAGVDTVEHASFLSPEYAELFARKPSWLVSTAGLVFHPQGLEKRFGETRIKERVLSARTAMVDSFRLARECGVRIAAGSDNMIDQFSYELQWMVDSGATTMEALQAGTRDAADACGLLDETGTLEAGKRADVIAVDGDPLEDIRSLSSVSFVIAGGTVRS